MNVVQTDKILFREPRSFWGISLVWSALFLLAHLLLLKNSSIIFLFIFFVSSVVFQRTLLATIGNKQVTSANSLPANVEETVNEELASLQNKNAAELGSLSKYLKKNSDYLLGIFADQFVILKKVESHTNTTKRLVDDVETKINGASDSSQQAQIGADIGRNHVTNLSASVESLNEVGDLLSEFSSVFQGLTSKMGEIDGVVFMAKLLSFNATVEAARVGELGQGMSVVALEMTKLAQQIGQTSKEIQNVLKASNDSLSILNSKITVLLTNSTDLISSTQTSLNSVIDEIYVLSGKISEITGALTDYKKSTVEMDDILSQITKTSNTLGTASANTDLVRLNLDELKNFNVPSTGTDS